MSAFTKINTEWKFDKLIPNESQAEIDKELEGAKQANETFVAKWKERDDYLKDPKILKEALDEYEALMSRWGNDGKAGYYIHLKETLNQGNAEIKAQYNKIDEFGKKLANEIQFFEIRIAKIAFEEQQKFLDFEELKPYKHFLERLFAESKYILSEAEEKILNLTSATSHSNWVKMTEAFLSKEEREVLNDEGKMELMPFTKIIGRIDHKDKEKRDSAANALNDIFEKHIEVGEHELNSVLANKKVIDELRGFDRPDATRHLSDDMDTEVVDALVEAVTGRFDIAERFYKLKAKLFGLEKLAYHERNLQYGEVEKEYKYEEGLELVYKVLNELDPEFGEILKGFNDESLIDVYPKKGKASGAFCAYNLNTQPTYIKLNFNNKLDDVLTLAHETGHGINNELMKKKQNSLNFKTPMATAEVASTFMEDFVLEEILKDADDELRFGILMMKLNDDISTIIRQIACYNLETDLHVAYREKGYLSKEEIGKIFLKNMKAYMGDGVSYDEGCENWWLNWSHIRYFFYVYSYSSGLLISKALQNSVKQDKSMISKVKEFLSAGTSESPKNIFANLGVDITDKTFWDKGMDEVERLLNETESLAKKLGKI
jgi:oligoendopeptidase F